jgi:hypothetical protein
MKRNVVIHPRKGVTGYFAEPPMDLKREEQIMPNWIPFEEGEYWVEQAYLVAQDKSALAIENPVIAIAKGPGGERYLKGQGLVHNVKVVELLEDNDTLDILLDLGGEFKYSLLSPQISSGKLFAPDIKSTLQFAPRKPWQQLSVEQFREEVQKLTRIDT